MSKRFEDVQLEEAAFDFGFAAMSLHWLARMKALTQVRAALKPGGHFAMWWNVYHNSAAPDAFGRATEHLFSGMEQDPNATNGYGAFALDVAARLGELRAAGFKDVEHRVFEQADNVHAGTAVGALLARSRACAWRRRRRARACWARPNGSCRRSLAAA